VSLIDPWPEHVNAIRKHGLQVSGVTEAERFTVQVPIMHLCDVEALSRQRPVDIALICTKSYDTGWSTLMIRPYLAPEGFAVSLQNAINEETIAEVVGWGRTLGCVASLICVELYEPGHVHRNVPLGGDAHTVFRVGEPHGRVTPRAQEVARLLSAVDSTKTTSNLWGERWSKLVANCMRNSVSAMTGLVGTENDLHEPVRRLILRIAGEAVRVGQALGYTLEDIYKLPPERLAAALDDPQAFKEMEERLLERTKRLDVGKHRASMLQDVHKGRRTEIDYLNGFVAARGAEVGIATPANAAITTMVREIERRERQPGLDNVALLWERIRG
jgi:2-dehydropantoate 2-reductase